MSFEAYTVAVRLTLINNVSAGLLGISRHIHQVDGEFAGAQKSAAALEARMLGIARLGMAGGALAGTGMMMLKSVKGAYEEAKKWAQSRADFENLNLSTIDNQRAYSQATNLAHQALGTTMAGNLKLIQDLHTATGDLNSSLALSGAYAQFSVAARVQNGGRDVENLVSNSIKALEHRGDRVMQDPAVRLQELARQSQVDFATKGRVSPSDYFHMSQTGKMAYTLASADFLYGPMAAMMSAKTGSTAGTQQMTTLSSLLGGHMTKKAIGFLRGLGLWEDQASPLTEKLKRDINSDPEVQKLLAATGDRLVQSGGLPAQLALLAAQDTNKFVLNVLAPAIRRKYGRNLTDDQLAMMYTQQFNRGTADDLSFWQLNQLKVAKDSSVINAAKSYSSAYEAYLKSPEGAEQAAEAAWRNLKTVVGSIYLPKVTDGLLGLAKSLDKLSAWTGAHPDFTKTLVGGFIALGTAMAIGGTVDIVTAGFKGLKLAMEFAGVGGSGGLVTMASRLTGIGGGLSAIGGATGFATIGASLTTIAGGLVVLYGVVKGMEWFLSKVVDPDTDPLNHPGQRRVRMRGKADTWVKDESLPQEHAGMHFLRAGRGGTWVPDDAKPASLPLKSAPPGWLESFFGGSGYVPTGRSGQGLPRGSVVPPPPQQTVQVNSTVNIDGRKVAEVVTSHQARAAVRPPSGPSGFDSSMGLAPVSYQGGN